MKLTTYSKFARDLWYIISVSREISSLPQLWAISFKPIFSAHKDSVHACTNLSKVIWIVFLYWQDCCFLEYKKKDKHWKNQQSKPKKVPKIARLDLAEGLWLRLAY